MIKASANWHLRTSIVWHRRTSRATFRSHTRTVDQQPKLVIDALWACQIYPVFDSLSWTELSWTWRTTRSQDQCSWVIRRQSKRWHSDLRCIMILKARYQYLRKRKSFQAFERKSKIRRKPYVSLSCQMTKRSKLCAVCSRKRMIRELQLPVKATELLRSVPSRLRSIDATRRLCTERLSTRKSTRDFFRHWKSSGRQWFSQHLLRPTKTKWENLAEAKVSFCKSAALEPFKSLQTEVAPSQSRLSPPWGDLMG